MRTYIVLGEFTEEFVTDIRNRTVASETYVESVLDPLDVTLEEVYVTMGQYDFVAVVEAPDDAAAAKGVLATAEGGGVRTETLPAFPAAEFDDLIEELPEPA